MCACRWIRWRFCPLMPSICWPSGCSTPLQIEHYLTRILEQAYRLGEKPVTPAIVAKTLAPDMHDLEPTLTRYGYNVKALAELLSIRQPKCARFSVVNCLPDGRKSCTSCCWPPGCRSVSAARWSRTAR